MHGLYAILDAPHPHGLPPTQQLSAILEATPTLALIQLRAKSATPAERRALAEQLAPQCLAADVPLIINDDVDLALSSIPGVAGVHLGQNDPHVSDIASLRARHRAPLVIGISTHNPQQLRAALAQHPDYVAYGPIRTTHSKADPDPVVGFGALADACRTTTTPLVAIGGLDPTAAARAIELGAAMVAVISGLVRPTVDETRTAAQSFAEAIGHASRWLDVDEVHAKIPVLSIESLTEIAAWAEDFGVLATLRLPPRFRPRIHDGVPRYRPSDVADLLAAIGKRDDESWDDWRARGDLGDETVVLLRRGR
jgi:thiamine-phosphate pyrophosphorylase